MYSGSSSYQPGLLMGIIFARSLPSKGPRAEREAELADVVAEAGVADQQALLDEPLEGAGRRLAAAAVGPAKLGDAGCHLPGPEPAVRDPGAKVLLDPDVQAWVLGLV